VEDWGLSRERGVVSSHPAAFILRCFGV
jgi:hypothetical protein